MDEFCRSCRYWKIEFADEHLAFGNCRKFAPSFDPKASLTNHTRWPTTDSDDWCGDYRPLNSAAGEA